METWRNIYSSVMKCFITIVQLHVNMPTLGTRTNIIYFRRVVLSRDKLARLRPLPERMALSPHQSMAAQLVSRTPRKINEV